MNFDPVYSNSVVHVNDASRAVTVVGDLLQKETSGQYKKSIKLDYESFRDKFLNRTKQKEYLSLNEARENKLQIEWKAEDIVKPQKLGIQVWNDFNLAQLKDFIDWTPFFRSWDLHGRYPNILEDDIVGQQANELFEDAQAMLSKVLDEKLLVGKAIFGLFPANQKDEDDILVKSSTVLENGKDVVFRTLRQQLKKREGIPNIALADFIAPEASGLEDYIGCFCVTAGFGTQELAQAYEKDHDDYSSIMIKALADRLAEAFAEYLHKVVRTDFWGYAKSETLSNEDLIDEKFANTQPFDSTGAVNKALFGDIMHDMMAVNRAIEVYLLDEAGFVQYSVVLDHDAPETKKKQVDLTPVKKFIAEQGANYT